MRIKAMLNQPCPLAARIKGAAGLALVVCLAGLPRPAGASGVCDGLTGADRRQCQHDQQQALTQANHDRAEAAKVARGGYLTPQEILGNSPTASAPSPVPPTPVGLSPPFRPTFRGTVNYTGTYNGEFYVGGKVRLVSGPVSLSVQISATNISLYYAGKGIIGSGHAYGGRRGDLCELTDNNSRWTGHCGPDGFLTNIESKPGNSPAFWISLKASDVSYPSAMDQAGNRPDPTIDAGALAGALANAMSSAMAQQATAEKQAHIRSNELGRRAVHDGTDISACLSTQPSYHNEFGPAQVGAGFMNRNHQVLDDFYKIVNSCGFAVDVTMQRGQVATIGTNGSFAPDLSTGLMIAKSARVHLY